MKIKKKHFLVAVFIIAGFLFMITFVFGMILNSISATTGMHRSFLQTIGTTIVLCLKEKNAFPKEDYLVDNYHHAQQSNQWYVVFDVAKLLSESNRKADSNLPKEYFDSNIWTVVKNIPENPPPNIIVLATRNIDPSSLRTKLTNEDMQKEIRFKDKKDDLWILNEFAVLIRADGLAISAPVVTPTSKRKYTVKYKYIYAGQPFDLTTNLVNGLQVKYLTPDGEVIPDND